MRDWVTLLVDPDSWVEDALAGATGDGLPAGGVLAGVGTAGDARSPSSRMTSRSKGSWGELTCEKQIRTLERADRELLAVFYLVDSAGGD